ncbi:MAG TPA: LamG-like jellyroll fold domain-containing protein, partial [Rhodothermales bacterium]|nr:LamG-like jellyroll fold domain-containing protein [Rhodothermales bacterium]
PDGDTLTYSWKATQGALSGEGASVTWTAPHENGYFTIACTVQDPTGAESAQATGITVGHLVGHYTFDGDALDASGFNNHGTVGGAMLTEDLFGGTGQAYAFDGVDDYIQIPFHPSLNFEDAVTINFWMKTDAALDREAFVISHGSWQNRWKVSITPEQRLRWTAKTKTGTYDLDSGPIMSETLYNVAVTYGDGTAQIYLNGLLEAETTWGGALLQTSLDLTIGQILPGDNQWNFAGVLDDIRIYNKVLSESEVRGLAGLDTAIEDPDNTELPSSTALYANYPNPFLDYTVLRYDLNRAGPVHILIFNLLGQKVRTLYSGIEQPGRKQITWDGRDEGGLRVASGVYLLQLRLSGQRFHRSLLRL